MIRKLFGAVNTQRQSDKKAREYRELIRQEATIGGLLFGPIPKGGRREFFCLDPHTWVWHEEWTDQNGKQHAVTTRFDVRPHGVFKAQDGQPYRPLAGQEATHFFQAARLYNKRVKSELYGLAA
jgi:hypothetical protein